MVRNQKNKILFSDSTLCFPAPLPVADNGIDTKLFDLAKSVHWIVDDSNTYTTDGSKRRRLLPGAGDDSDDDASAAPPTHDIYRLRQAKRYNK